MNIFRTLHSSILVLFAVVVISTIALAHFTMSKIVTEQSRAQQQSLSPAFRLVTEQILRPLHIAQTLSRSTEIRQFLLNEVPNEEQIFTTLQRLNSEFGYKFFIASESARKQYNSDRTTHDLVIGEVSWYFKYRNRDQDAVADIGKWEDTHFYIDLKIFDDNGKFVGFFGTGQSLREFLKVFATYKETYGYDFIFVDDEKNITLSSDPELNAEQSNFNKISDLRWYQTLPEEVQEAQDLNNRLVTHLGEEYLIAEIKIEPFNWTMYLLSPLQARQTESSRGFIVSVVTLLLIIFVLFLVIYNLLYYFKQDMQNKVKNDPITSLPSRKHTELRYNDLQHDGHAISLILISIDNIKMLSDTHGQQASDEVLQRCAEYLQSKLRPEDILGRWSSEEFILVLPDKGPHEAYDIAQALRAGISELQPLTRKPNIKVTGSFGISFTATARPLSEVSDNADDALYQAKRDGANLVRMQLIESV